MTSLHKIPVSSEIALKFSSFGQTRCDFWRRKLIYCLNGSDLRPIKRWQADGWTFSFLLQFDGGAGRVGHQFGLRQRGTSASANGRTVHLVMEPPATDPSSNHLTTNNCRAIIIFAHSLVLEQTALNCAPPDSSSKALSKVFWLRIDTALRSVATGTDGKGAERWRWLPPSPAAHYSYRHGTKNKVVEHVKYCPSGPLLFESDWTFHQNWTEFWPWCRVAPSLADCTKKRRPFQLQMIPGTDQTDPLFDPQVLVDGTNEIGHYFGRGRSSFHCLNKRHFLDQRALAENSFFFLLRNVEISSAAR